MIILRRLFLFFLLLITINISAKKVQCYIVVEDIKTKEVIYILVEIEESVLKEKYLLSGYWKGIPMYRRYIESEEK